MEKSLKRKVCHNARCSNPVINPSNALCPSCHAAKQRVPPAPPGAQPRERVQQRTQDYVTSLGYQQLLLEPNITRALWLCHYHDFLTVPNYTLPGILDYGATRGFGESTMTPPGGGHASPVTAIAAVHDGAVMTGHADGRVVVWRQEFPLELFPQTKGMPIRAVWISQDKRFVLSASDDGTVCITKTDDGAERLLFPAHDGAILSMCVSTDGRIIMTSGVDGNALLSNTLGSKKYSFDIPHVVHVCLQPKEGVFGLCDSVGRVHIATNLESMEPRILEDGRGEERAAPIMAACAGIDGIVFTCDADGHIACWSLAEGLMFTVPSGTTGPAPHVAIACSKDYPLYFATASADGAFLWDLNTRSRYALSYEKCTALCWASHGGAIYIGTAFGAVTVVTLVGWDCREYQQLHDDIVTGKTDAVRKYLTSFPSDPGRDLFAMEFLASK